MNYKLVFFSLRAPFHQETRKKIELDIEDISETVADLMRKGGNTMVDKARDFMAKGIISEKVYHEVERDFGY